MEPKIKRVYLPKVKTILVIFILFCLSIAGVKALLWSLRFMKETSLTPVTIVKLLVDTGASLKASDGRTNIVLLGIGGGTHDGADLTDTMIVASVDTEHSSLGLVSVPRDTWSESLKDKVNSAYHYGEEKKKGGGMILAKAIVEDVVGLPLHYGFMIDFSGFKDIIDMVGGVDLVVPTGFTDPEFPIPGKEKDLCGGDKLYACRYESLHFNVGLQHMDGDLALKYVRTRHAEGAEGTDFARSRRQQDVLVSLKQKLLTPTIWTSPKRIKLLFEAFDRATTTDMTIGELATLGKIFLGIKQDHIQRVSIEDGLENPPAWQYDGKYVLVPKKSFDELHTFIKSQLK